MGLGEPQSAEGVQGVGIKIGEFGRLPEHDLRPGLDLLRLEGVQVGDDRAELGMAVGTIALDLRVGG